MTLDYWSDDGGAILVPIIVILLIILHSNKNAVIYNGPVQEPTITLGATTNYQGWYK